MEQTFSVFNITSPINQLVDVEDKFDLVKTIEDDETEMYISKDVYHHDLEDDPKNNFDYRYAIEAWYNHEDNTTYYHLYLIPCFSSLSEKRKADVLEMIGDDDASYVTETDVHDYGMNLIFGREEQKGEYDKAVMDKIASVVDVIDRMRGFYLDKAQNRIGTTGWMLLDDYLNDVDFTKATLEK